MTSVILKLFYFSQLFHLLVSFAYFLLLQKMEIKSEADDVDEGVSVKEARPLSAISNENPSKWTSPRIRKKLRTLKSFSKSIST